MSYLLKPSLLLFRLVVALGCLTSIVGAQSIEYLPATQWHEPVVVTPGKTIGEPPSDAIVLFDGSDLSAWLSGDNWLVENGIATCKQGNITTKQMFGDCQLHLEWSVPQKVSAAGQNRGNSGVFLMGQYEVQVLDSFNSSTYPEGQAGAIYKQIPPMVNAMRPQAEWNVYDIFWTVPVIEDPVTRESDVIQPATITVVHNGVLIINHHEVAGATYWHQPPAYENLSNRDEAGNLVGPIMLQDHGNPVQFRNIWVRELKQPTGSPREPMFINHANGQKWPADKNMPKQD